MAVVVFDADVLIAYLGREDAHHSDAVKRIRDAFEPGTRRFVSAVNYSEVLIVRLGIETIQVDMVLARRAAAVRARTKLRLPGAYALATAIHAEHRGHDDVRLETFDKQVVKAYANLHPLSPDPS